MTLSDVQTWIDNALASYAAGGAGWQITSGVTAYDAPEKLHDASGSGTRVSAWIGNMPKNDQADSAYTFEIAVTIWAEGVVVGDESTRLTDAAKLTDDLVRMIIKGTGAPQTVDRTIELVQMYEPQITAEEAYCAAQFRCYYTRKIT